MLPGSAAGSCSGCSVIGGSVGCRPLPPEDLSQVPPSTEQSFSTNKHTNVRPPQKSSLACSMACNSFANKIEAERDRSTVCYGALLGNWVSSIQLMK